MTIQEKYCETLEKRNKIENLEKQVCNEETKIPLMPSKAIIKPSTFNGNSSWQSPNAKAFHLAASLEGDAADILETLSEAQRDNFYSLLSALELNSGKFAQKNIAAYN